MVDFHYKLSTNETSSHLKCRVNFYQLTSWSIVTSDWCTCFRCQPLVLLGKCLECCSIVINTLQTMHGFSFFSTIPNFIFWWFSIPFFKGLHIHMFDQRLGPFNVIKVGLKVYKLSIIVDAAFLLFVIVICSLKHPTLIPKLDQNELWLVRSLLYSGHLV